MQLDSRAQPVKGHPLISGACSEAQPDIHLLPGIFPQSSAAKEDAFEVGMDSFNVGLCVMPLADMTPSGRKSLNKSLWGPAFC